MPTTETEINTALAEVLNGMRRRWTVSGEPTGQFAGSARRPGVLVTEQDVAPVVIETEFFPAGTVERDALARLGEKVTGGSLEVLAVLAVRIPERFREVSQAELRAELSTAQDLEYALFTDGTAEDVRRFPRSGWFRGRTTSIANIIHKAAVPESAVETAVESLERGVSIAANILGHAVSSRPDISGYISEALRQEDSLQTRRMAMTIVANAFVFYESLSGSFGIRGPLQLRTALGHLLPNAFVDERRKILDINYWPIFDIALQIVISIPTKWSARIFDELSHTANDLIAQGVTRSHDLSGTVFQRLVADRKFLATFYTRPSAAALLASIAIPDHEDWSNTQKVKNFTMADFACGTGTLLSSVYQRVGQLHEQSGGDSQALHPHMMERTLIGMDVMPSAVHLTASMIASAYRRARSAVPDSTLSPTDSSQLRTMPSARWICCRKTTKSNPCSARRPRCA